MFSRRPRLHPHGLPPISELSAIVTVSDDGGSSGRLRKELNLPAPGDIRNCIVALSEEEALLSRFFNIASLLAKDWEAIASATCFCRP